MPIFYDKIYGRKLYICLYDTHTDDRTNTALASVPRQVTQFTHHVTHTETTQSAPSGTSNTPQLNIASFNR